MKVLRRFADGHVPLASSDELAGGDRRLGAPSSGRIMFLAGAGFFAGMVVLFADKPWWREARNFSAPGFFFWLFVILAETSMWPVAASFVLGVLRELQTDWRKPWREVAGSGAVLTALVVVMGTMTDANISRQIVPGYRVKGALFLLMGFAVVLSAAVGIWLIHNAFLGFRTDLPDHGRAIEEFLRLKNHLQSLLSVLVALLVGIILGSIAHRMTILSLYPPTLYPLEWIVVYGAFASTLLGLVFAPTYFRMLIVGRELLDAWIPVRSLPASSEILDWAERRKALQDVLELNKVTGRTLRAFGGVLAPLASAIIGAVLGK